MLGIGNVLFGDEGLGVYVARTLLAHPEALPAGTRVIEAGTALGDCLGEALDADAVTLVDAVRAGGPPGSIVALDESRLAMLAANPTTTVSLHDLGVREFLTTIVRLSSRTLHTRLLGAEPACCAPRLGLTPPLERAAEAIAAMIVRREHEGFAPGRQAQQSSARA